MTDAADRLYERLLVLRAQARDEAAFAELVERYQPRLRYYLRKMLRDGPAAEDALQDVWLSAFRAWLYRIARDRAAREFRKRGPPPEPLGDVEPPAGPADEVPFAADDVERVHAALDELGPEHREALVLRYVEGMTYEEVARVAGCPVGTVRSRLHHAKAALRAVLERMNVHD